MNAISDDDLVLFHYRDGLSVARIAEIEDALLGSQDLRRRYAQLRRTLEQVEAAPLPAPDAAFEARLWRQLEARIGSVPRTPIAAPWRERWQRLKQALSIAPPAFATACVLLLAVGIAFYAGRRTAPLPAPGIAAGATNPVATRVLDAYVAQHLRSTEGLLLTALNSDSAELRAGNKELAAALVDSNRLYAAAAARAGNLRLAEFLRQLEPVLIELANQPAAASVQGDEGLREYLAKTDLLFQVRATQARMARDAKHPDRSI